MSNTNVVQLHENEMSDAELTAAADGIGLRPIRAFVKKERSGGAERQAKYRERKAAQGEKQITITGDEKLLEAVKSVQAKVAAGKPIEAALAELSVDANLAAQAPVIDWKSHAEALQVRIDAHNARPFWQRVFRAV